MATHFPDVITEDIIQGNAGKTDRRVREDMAQARAEIQLNLKRRALDDLAARTHPDPTEARQARNRAAMWNSQIAELRGLIQFLERLLAARRAKR